MTYCNRNSYWNRWLLNTITTKNYLATKKLTLFQSLIGLKLNKKTEHIQKLLSFSRENRWNTTRPWWENEIWLNTSQGQKARAKLSRFKIMLHGTIRNNYFHGNTAWQCWNNVAAIRNKVATVLQRCVALKIVIANLLV